MGIKTIIMMILSNNTVQIIKKNVNRQNFNRFFVVMDVKLLLNFPKIKKDLNSEDQLIDALNEFIKESKPNDINFELKEIEEGRLGIKKRNKA